MHIAELPDSMPLLGDPMRLRERWAQDGTLFFKNAIGASSIAKVRQVYLDRLKKLQLVDQHETQSIWTGSDRLDGTLAEPIDDDVWKALVADASFDNVVSTLLGEAPTWVPIVVHRTAPPAPKGSTLETFGARHQDGIYNYGIDFATCWVPLMDIDDEVGGLAVVPGSHKASLYPADVFKDPDRRVGIPAGTIPDEAWRRPDYKAGDLLIFHSMTAHAGLPNRSDKMRLSIDIRFLPSSGVPLVGKVVSNTTQDVTLRTQGGTDVTLGIGDRTIVRGPKGHPVVGKDRDGIIFPGAEIIIMPNADGSAKLIRSVSRKYIDLPATWYETLPAGWVK